MKHIPRKILVPGVVAIVLIFILLLVRAFLLPPIYYNSAQKALDAGSTRQALSLFMKSYQYKDSAQQVRQLSRSMKVVEAGMRGVVALKSDGTLLFAADDEEELREELWEELRQWRDIKAVALGSGQVLGLKTDGTVVSTTIVPTNDIQDVGQGDVSGWTDIVEISAGHLFAVGLKADGTVVATGDNEYGQCDVEDWKDIVSISCGGGHTLGVKENGKVIATGYNENGMCDVESWRNIIAVSAGGVHSVGLKSSGRVVVAGSKSAKRSLMLNSKNIISVSAGENQTVGLKKDGKIVYSGTRWLEATVVQAPYVYLEPLGWEDIVSITAAGINGVVAVKADGTIETSESRLRRKTDQWLLFD